MNCLALFKTPKSFLFLLIICLVSYCHINRNDICKEVDSVIDLGFCKVKENDPRQAFHIFRELAGLQCLSTHQRLRVQEGFVMTFNCSRYVDIESLSLQDIVRDDSAMFELPRNYIKKMIGNVTLDDKGEALSFAEILQNAFMAGDMDKVVWLSQSVMAVETSASNYSLSIMHKALGTAFGRLTEFQKAAYHFHLCSELSGNQFGCASMLKITMKRLNDPHIVIYELGNRVSANRLISTARVNMDTISRLQTHLRVYQDSISKESFRAAIRIIWDCKRFLLYHGWISYEEALLFMEKYLSEEIQGGVISDTDNYGIFKINIEFGRWRRNGSEFAYWERWEKNRNKKLKDLDRCTHFMTTSNHKLNYNLSILAIDDDDDGDETTSNNVSCNNDMKKEMNQTIMTEITAEVDDAMDVDAAMVDHHHQVEEVSLDYHSTHHTCDASYIQPYVLRLVTAGMAADNFGHSQHDVLWPVIVAIELHDRLPRVNATIYVINVGLFILLRLREAYPQREFRGFSRVEEVPLEAEEIIITGLGAPKEFDPPCISVEDMLVVKHKMWNVCNVSPIHTTEKVSQSQCTTNKSYWSTVTSSSTVGDILLIERRLTTSLQEQTALNVQYSLEMDHPALKRYYDGGMWQQHVLSSKRILGSLRRHILNHKELFEALNSSFPHRVFSFNPEEYSFCEQLQAFAAAKVVIGQHGAALSMSGYMTPTTSTLLELEPILNSIFSQITSVSLLRYERISMDRLTTSSTGSDVSYYLDREKNRNHIILNINEIVRLVSEIIV